MTTHFSALTEAEQERLVILIEECGEVIQSGCKILRHGYENYNPTTVDGETNRQSLEREIGDLMHAVERMEIAHDVSASVIVERRHSKPQRIEKYLHHQESREGRGPKK